MSTDGSERLDEYAAAWLRRRRVRGRPLAPGTVALYETLLRVHVLPALGRTPLERLTRAGVREWYDALAETRGPMVAAKSYRLLRAVMVTAVEDGLLEATPCTLRGAGDEWSPERPVLSVEQVLALADEVPGRYRAAILLAAFCCLRTGELAALRRAAVDLAAPTITVRASAGQVAGRGYVTGPPKSAAGRRTVTVPDAVVPDLAAHLDTYAQPGPQGLVLPGERGGPLRSSRFGAAVFRPAAARLGLTGVHMHDLRHTGNTLAAASGASLADLMARMGHASSQAALRYQHATRAQDAALADHLSGLVRAARAARAAQGLDRAGRQA
jgi:integrase